jgi:hypothetical protein
MENLSFRLVHVYVGDERLELTIMSNETRFHIYFDSEELCGYGEDETLVKEFKRFKENLDTDGAVMEEFENWMVKPCADLIKHLALSVSGFDTPTLEQVLNPETFIFKLHNVGGVLDAELRQHPTDDEKKIGLQWGVSSAEPCVVEALRRVPAYPATHLAIVTNSSSDNMDYDLSPKTVEEIDTKMKYYFKPASYKPSFVKELTALLDIDDKLPQENLGLPKLVGIVVCGDGAKIAGLLVEYIHGSKTLERRIQDNEASKGQREDWLVQVRNMVTRLHEADIIWGHVHPNYILIDSHGDAWATDFGEGYIKGWIDPEQAGTKDADLEALSKLERYLEIKSEPEEGNAHRVESSNMKENLDTKDAQGAEHGISGVKALEVRCSGLKLEETSDGDIQASLKKAEHGNSDVADV